MICCVLYPGQEVMGQGEPVSTVCRQSTVAVNFSDGGSKNPPTFESLEFVCIGLSNAVQVSVC